MEFYIITLNRTGSGIAMVDEWALLNVGYLLCSWQTEELQLVRDALRSLRNGFGGHDPQHHTLDTLEQGVSSLMDRLYTLESRHRHDRKVDRVSADTRLQGKHEGPGPD